MCERDSFGLDPNPVRHTLHLEGDFNDGQMSIYDITGRKVYQGEYQNELSVIDLNSGLYFLQVTTNEGQVFTQKFIIEK